MHNPPVWSWTVSLRCVINSESDLLVGAVRFVSSWYNPLRLTGRYLSQRKVRSTAAPEVRVCSCCMSSWYQQVKKRRSYSLLGQTRRIHFENFAPELRTQENLDIKQDAMRRSLGQRLGFKNTPHFICWFIPVFLLLCNVNLQSGCSLFPQGFLCAHARKRGVVFF